jgi:hypothetical protein
MFAMSKRKKQKTFSAQEFRASDVPKNPFPTNKTGQNESTQLHN